jgi:hypothetical protein
MALDEQKVEQAVGKVFGELGVAIPGGGMSWGDHHPVLNIVLEARP